MNAKETVRQQYPLARCRKDKRERRTLSAEILDNAYIICTENEILATGKTECRAWTAAKLRLK